MSRGFISILSLAFILLALSLPVAGWITWQLYQQNLLPAWKWNSTSQLEPTELPQPSSNLGLEPIIDLAPNLDVPTNIIQQNLISPMRAYYATKSDQLRSIKVTKVPSDLNHDLSVTITLTNQSSDSRSLSFFYDQSRDEDGNQTGFPTWSPSLFDNTD
jgi:hypothetical protein